MPRTMAPALIAGSSTQGSPSITTVSPMTCSATSQRNPPAVRTTPKARATVSPMIALCSCPRMAWTASGVRIWSSGRPSRSALQRRAIRRRCAMPASRTSSCWISRAGNRTTAPLRSGGSAPGRSWSGRRPRRCQSASAVSAATTRGARPACAGPVTNNANAALAPAMASWGHRRVACEDSSCARNDGHKRRPSPWRR